MTLQQLATRYRKAEARVESTRDDLYAAIRKAHQEGQTLRAIAATTGLTFGRVHQIVRKTR